MDARRFLTAQEQERLRARVREVERSTGCELVIVVATESGRYDRAEMMVGALCTALTLVGADALAVAEGAVGAPLWAQGAAVGVGLSAGVLLASLVRAVRRPFVSEREIAEEVRRAALSCYAEHGVGETSHGAGVLVYLSLFERRLEVVLDSAAQAAAGDAFAEVLARAAGAALRRGARAEAIEAVLAAVDRALAGKLPPRPQQDGEHDGELEDGIVIVHPRP